MGGKHQTFPRNPFRASPSLTFVYVPPPQHSLVVCGTHRRSPPPSSPFQMNLPQGLPTPSKKPRSPDGGGGGVREMGRQREQGEMADGPPCAPPRKLSLPGRLP